MKNKFFLSFAVVALFVISFMSCEDSDDDVKTSKVECTIDGASWAADKIMYGDSDSLFTVAGIKGTDTLQFAYYKDLEIILYASYNEGSNEYYGLLSGGVETSTSSDDEESGSFSKITLYDNIFFPEDSVVITNCSFTVLK